MRQSYEQGGAFESSRSGAKTSLFRPTLMKTPNFVVLALSAGGEPTW